MEELLVFGYFGFWIIGGLVILLLGWLVYDKRYKPRDGQGVSGNKHGFHPTPECFIDPKDGFKYRVWYNPYTGERDYVREDDK